MHLTATRLCKSSTAAHTLITSASSVTTQFAANNGGLPGWVVMFDMNVANPQGISLRGFDHNIGSLPNNAPFTYAVYLTPGSYVGKDNNIEPWRLVGSGSGFTNQRNLPSPGVLDAPVYLAPGSYGVGIQINGASVAYTGTGSTNTPVVYTNADFTLTLGAARSTLFAGGAYYQIREWNGTIYYDTCANNGTSGYGFFAPGCAGTQGIPDNRIVSPPRLGRTMAARLDSLPPPYTAFFMVGTSRTASPFGPLPVDLAGYGAPGCFGHVSPDAITLLFGAAGTATWTKVLPGNSALLCMPFYTQGLAIDPATNALGAIMTDAAAGVLGM